MAIGEHSSRPIADDATGSLITFSVQPPVGKTDTISDRDELFFHRVISDYVFFQSVDKNDNTG